MSTGPPWQRQRSEGLAAVLSFPSPSGVAFIAVLVALVTSGLFVGNWFHNQTVGGSWLIVMRACASVEPAMWSPECIAVEQRRALFEVVGALIPVLGGVALVWALPPWLERKRSLRPVPAALGGAVAAIDELARRQSLQRIPIVRKGSLALRDGFSYGWPGHYRVALPPRALVLAGRSEVFDALVSHELAHVKRNDVAYAWYSVLVWRVLLGVMVVPVLAALIRRDLSELPNFLWRAALLLAVVLLTTSALLRLREHEADLAAAVALDDAEVVERTVTGATQGRGVGWRRWLALHPSPARRVAVVRDPTLLGRTDAALGAVLGLLTGMAAPLVLLAAAALQLGERWAVAAVVLGGPVGVWLGLSLWREALVFGGGPAERTPWRLALAMGAGMVLGDIVSLGQIDVEANRWFVLCLLLAAASAVASIWGLGRLWSSGGQPHRPGLLAGAVGALVWTGMLSLLLWLRPVIEIGPQLARGALLSDPPTVAVLLSLLLALTALAGTRRARGSQHVSGRRAVLAGSTAGVVGAVILTTTSLAAPPADESAFVDRFYVSVWLAGCVGAAAVLALSVLVGPVGAGEGLLAGPIATILVVAGQLVSAALTGGLLDAQASSVALQAALATGLVVGTAATLPALVPRSARNPVPVRIVAMTAGVAGAAASTVCLIGA